MEKGSYFEEPLRLYHPGVFITVSSGCLLGCLRHLSESHVILFSVTQENIGTPEIDEGTGKDSVADSAWFVEFHSCSQKTKKTKKNARGRQQWYYNR